MKYIFLLFFVSWAMLSNAQQVILKSIRLNNRGGIVEIKVEIQSQYDTLVAIIDGSANILSIQPKNASDFVIIEYFDRYNEPELIGKLSMINQTRINYYLRGVGPDENMGKISEIGKTKVDYYYADPDKTGRVYFIGNLIFNYYTRANDAALAAKISKIGTVEADYFSSFSDLELRGHLKSLGKYTFEYYTQYDDNSKMGKIKKVNGKDNRFELIIDL